MKPITEDYLIELKLPKRAVSTGAIPYNEYSIRNNFDIYCQMQRSGDCLFWGEHILWGEHIQGEDFFIIKCDTIEVFQNIYKMLTGKELVIK